MIAWKIARFTGLKEALKLVLTFIQSLRLTAQEASVRMPAVSLVGKSRPRLFNLDVHIAVIGDLKVAIETEADLMIWSISQHNWVNRRVLKMPDPVRVINAETWRDMDSLVDSFLERYSPMLRRFDGFVACYPVPIIEAYKGFGKPILVQTAVRYEAPYTSNQRAWDDLNRTIVDLDKSGLLEVFANNKGDQDYFEHFTGIAPTYLPSLCDYTGTTWSGDSNHIGLMCGNSGLASEILSLDSSINDLRTLFPTGYTYRQFFSLRALIVIPYQISTMTLFECATAGMPVLMPSKALLKEWFAQGLDGVLSQLSFFQTVGESTHHLPLRDPNRVSSPDTVTWWLDRADFFDFELMPNVVLFDSVQEIPLLINSLPSYLDTVRLSNRNRSMAHARAQAMKAFITRL